MTDRKKSPKPADRSSQAKRRKGDSSKPGRSTPKDERFRARKASPDDPIYTRGFVIGGRYSRRSSKDTPSGSGERRASSWNRRSQRSDRPVGGQVAWRRAQARGTRRGGAA